MQRRHLLITSCILLTTLNTTRAQPAEGEDAAAGLYPEYYVNYKVSVPGIIAGAAIGLLGQDRIRRKDDITMDELLTLDPAQVPGIDRIALRQNVDKAERARKISDHGINYATLMPVLLFIDRRMREDWLDVALVYVESQVAVMNVYSWTFLGPTFIERYRPITYYDEVSMRDRIWGGNKNSFYSGHVSTVSTWSFFMAKSYIDYHPEVGALKWAIYGVAAIPPAFIGIKRVQGLKHFPTDVIAGYLIGAAGGILWPELHKKEEGNLGLSFMFEPEMKLVNLSYTF